jgi:HD superfamily phosphohydrolase YqeK
MNKLLVHKLIDQAVERLSKQAFDEAHDLRHAEAVWKTAEDICTHIDKVVNKDIIKIACYWHDVVVTPKTQWAEGKNVSATADYLEKKMTKAGFEQESTQKTVAAIRWHEFDDEPVNIEGQIVWDADKLEPFNPDRWLGAIHAVQAGKMTEAKFDALIDTGLKWLKVLRHKYHFDYSRKLFDERLTALLNYPAFIDLAKKKHVDRQALFKLIGS